MSTKQVCPNCPEEASRLLFETKEGRRILECRHCRLQFAEAYPDYETADTKIYSEAYFGGALEKKKERERNFTGLVEQLETVLGRTGRLLDVGAGEGVLMNIAASRGWQVQGTEIASVMIDYVRKSYGFTIHEGMLEDIPLPSSSFDAVVLNHVLEHVKNPRSTLEKIGGLLTPGGLIRIEVPNLAGLSSRAKNLQSHFKLKSNPWKHYATGHHFWFFTPATLQYTVLKAGLIPVLINAPARQWGNMSLLERIINGIYKRTLWGGHLVMYAGRKR
jgi:2-polyprenyl-3-methyl-5-hydroxy-6-metoxy-1,4-benzoquinol methylase